MLGGAAIGYPAIQEPESEPSPRRLVRLAEQKQETQKEKKHALEKAAKQLENELSRLESELADMRAQLQKGGDARAGSGKNVARESRVLARAKRAESQERRKAEASDRRAAAEFERAVAKQERRVAGLARKRAAAEREIAQRARDIQAETRMVELRKAEADANAAQADAARQIAIARLRGDTEKARAEEERILAEVHAKASQGDAKSGRRRVRWNRPKGGIAEIVETVEAIDDPRPRRGGVASGRAKAPRTTGVGGLAPSVTYSTGIRTSGGQSSGGSVINITVEEGDVHIHADGAEIRTTKGKSAGGAFQFGGAPKSKGNFLFGVREVDDDDDDDDDHEGHAHSLFGSLNGEDDVILFDVDGAGRTDAIHVHGTALDALKKAGGISVGGNFGGLAKLKKLEGTAELEEIEGLLENTRVQYLKALDLKELKDLSSRKDMPFAIKYKIDTGDGASGTFDVEGMGIIELDVEIEDCSEEAECDEEEEAEVIENVFEAQEDGDHKFVWQNTQQPVVASGAWMPATGTPVYTTTVSPFAGNDDDELVELAREILNELRGMRAELQQMRHEVSSASRSFGPAAPTSPGAGPAVGRRSSFSSPGPSAPGAARGGRGGTLRRAPRAVRPGRPARTSQPARPGRGARSSRTPLPPGPHSPSPATAPEAPSRPSPATPPTLSTDPVRVPGEVEPPETVSLPVAQPRVSTAEAERESAPIATFLSTVFSGF